MTVDQIMNEAAEDLGTDSLFETLAKVREDKRTAVALLKEALAHIAQLEGYADSRALNGAESRRFFAADVAKFLEGAE